MTILVFATGIIETPGGMIVMIYLNSFLQSSTIAILSRLFTDIDSKENDCLRWIDKVC